MQDISNLIKEYEKSISATMLQTLPLPPKTQVTSSDDQHQRAIVGKNSFATVKEMELRNARINSIVDNGGFFLTARPELLKLDGQSLPVFRNGIKLAMHIVDRLSDIKSDAFILHMRDVRFSQFYSLEFDTSTGEGRAVEEDARCHMFQSHMAILRARQAVVLRACSDLDLAWAITLFEGAMAGWHRRTCLQVRSDALFKLKKYACGQNVLHYGSFFIWALVRGSGEISS